MKDLTKVLLKLLDENQDRLRWVHFCYLSRELYLKYLVTFDLERAELAEAVSRWAREDFNIDLPMTTAKDISILKALIFDKYHSIYPHITRTAHNDHQGWLRVWVSTHMEKDLRKA